MKRALLTMMLCLSPFGVQAAEKQDFTATYSLMAGGVRMVSVAADFDLGPDSYDVRTDARTTGIFEKLLPWNGLFKTTGEDEFQPVRHDYTVSWRGDVEQSTFLYEPAGNFKSMTLTKDGETKENPVDPEIAEGTRDLLSAVMLMFDQYGETGSCAVDVPAFDNARSFIIRFKDAGNAMLDNPNLSSYTGPAHGCSVEIIPQKGKWPKKPRGWLRIQKQAVEDGRLPTLWLAKPRDDLPAIPVRIDIHTKYGDVIAHLNGVE